MFLKNILKFLSSLFVSLSGRESAIEDQSLEFLASSYWVHVTLVVA